MSPKEVHERCQQFVQLVVQVMQSHNGVVMSLYPDHVIASWNAFRPCHMHETTACATGLHVLGEASTLDQNVHAVVTTGSVLVGFVGSDKLGMKRPVVTGHPMDDLDPLGELCAVLQSGLLITEAVAKKVDARFDVVPVDVVTLHNNTSTVFEVLSEDNSREQQATFEAQCEGYKVGFSRFVARKYTDAMAFLTKFLENHGRDVKTAQVKQALRLLRLAMHLEEQSSMSNPSATSFSRRYPGWENYERSAARIALPTGLLCDLDTTVQDACGPHSTGVLSPGEESLSMSTVGSPAGKDRVIGFDAEFRKQLDLARKGPLSPTNQGLESAREKAGESGASVDAAFFQASNDASYRCSDKLLGTGATSQVYLGLQDDGSLVALKYVAIPTDDAGAAANSRSRRRIVKRDEIEEVLREVNLLAPLRHDNIVAFLGSAISGNKLVIVTEYVSGGSLTGTLQSFGSLPVRTVKRYLGDILRGLQYLHKNGIVHRDIKPHNVLLQIDGQCKLTDFGAASQLSTIGSNDSNVIGTPLYMAPEACLGKATPASDIWSVGIMTVELITGRLPWGPEQLGEPFIPPRFIYRLGHEEALRPVVPVGDPRMTSAAVDFVSQCLNRNESERPTVEALITHAFFM
jgi:hypothetical protein